MLEFATTSTAQAAPAVMETAAPVLYQAPQVQAPVNAATIADAITRTQGVQDLSQGIVYDIFTIPTSFTATVSSNAATGSSNKTTYLFNNNTLNAAVTDNGAGTASMSTTFGDGFSGKVYENYMRSANNGRGVLIKGFTIVATNFTSGAQVSSAFNTLAMNLITSNGQGGTIPVPIDVAEAVRNTQFQAGTLTVAKMFYLNAINQLQFVIPANTIFSFTFFTQASGFKG